MKWNHFLQDSNNGRPFTSAKDQDPSSKDWTKLTACVLVHNYESTDATVSIGYQIQLMEVVPAYLCAFLETIKATHTHSHTHSLLSWKEFTQVEYFSPYTLLALSKWIPSALRSPLRTWSQGH